MNQWKALFISPNDGMIRELTPLLGNLPGDMPITEIREYLNRQQLEKAFSAKNVNLCFLDAVSDQTKALELLPELLKAEPSLAVVALLSVENADLILSCLRLGAAGFLVQPFTSDHLEETMSRLATLSLSAKTTRKDLGNICCVMPAKGACGASTLACNLAHQWKRLGSKKILLADLDPFTGTQAFLLKIKSDYSFMDVLNRSSTLDADLWTSIITSWNGVDVLLSPELLADGVHDLTGAQAIIDYARQNYQSVILDTSSVYGDWNLSQAKVADEILLVTTNELPALHATQRALAYLESNGIGHWKIRLTVNRYDRDCGLSADSIGAALGMEVFHLLPSDYDGMQKALMDGKPIPASSNFGKSMIALADRLAGRETTVKKSSSFGGLRSFFSKGTLPAP